MELLTNEIRRRLPKLYATTTDRDPVLHVEFFSPWSSQTWWASEFDGQDIFYGLYEHFDTEWCFFSLKELEAIRGPEGLRIVRDPKFTPDFASRIDRRQIARIRSASRGLLPEEIRQRLPKRPPPGQDLNPVFLLKLIDASLSRAWYVSAFDGDDCLYGIVEDEGRWLSWGSFSLSELESDPEPGCGTVERDFWFQPALASEIIKGKQVTSHPTRHLSDLECNPVSLASLLKRFTAPEPVALATDDGIQRLPSETGVVFLTNEETYDHFLDALPPRFMDGHLFCFAEGSNPYTLFFRHGGQYFVRRLSEAETKELRRLAGDDWP